MSDRMKELRDLAVEATRLAAASSLLASEFDPPREDEDGEANASALLIKASIEFEQGGALLRGALYREIDQSAALAKASDQGSDR